MLQSLRDLPLEERALRALRVAVKKAIAEHTRAGLPVYIWSGGKVVKLPAGKFRAHSRPPSKRGTRAEVAPGFSPAHADLKVGGTGKGISRTQR